MDYTSVPNIMKVIKPLFLDGLHEDFDKYYDNEKKLWALLARVQKIKVFDPACGSGNFLIIAYKELRQLQHAIIGRIDELMPTGIGIKIPDNQLLNINNFYGIEIDDFAHELAVLSLFLAKHQMNQEFTQQFGKSLSIIPLIDIPTIVRGNATRLDWQAVCANVGHTITAREQSALFELEGEQAELQLGETTYDEIYLIGNPPYKGYAKQSDSQKDDMAHAFNGRANYKKLDYIACWFEKGSSYIEKTKAQIALVTTNSVTQGEQVSLLWPHIFNRNIEISFCYTSFKWRNSARDNAGVTVAIIGLYNEGTNKYKYVYSDEIIQQVDAINAYLVGSQSNTIVLPSTRSISKLPEMIIGSKAGDGGNLLLSSEEKDNLVANNPGVEKYIKSYIGAEEFLGDKKTILHIC
jgi:hypothetical protein